MEHRTFLISVEETPIRSHMLENLFEQGVR
jgi:hypothetical protein